MNNTTKLSSIQLDIAFAFEDGEDREGAVETLLANAGLTGRVTASMLVEFGPGGGWPVYEFAGEQADIDRLLAVYMG